MIYKQGLSMGILKKNEYHAWNEVLIDNNWISLDATWDAGYINNGQFVKKTPV